jgi:DDE superfamily endonuclease
VESWCVPPDADGEYVWHMEDVIQTYMLPYDAKRPVVCFDEASRQLFGEVREPEPVEPGRRAKEDYEYERKGTCNLFMMCEPLRGWRHVKVTDRRTRRDYAECLKELVDVHYPRAEKVVLVQDHLNTHSGGSLYEAYPPAEALRILNKVEFHYTPKHGSWLNMAESEISILSRQCLDRRLDCQSKVVNEVTPWEHKRNEKRVRVHWTFTLAVARQKLRKLYPTIED